MRIQVSHGADPEDWFVVRPQPGHVTQSAAGTDITNAMAVQGLREAGRTVIELDVQPWQGHASGQEARQALREARKALKETGGTADDAS